VLAAIRVARLGVVSFENHSVIGGLGSAVAEVMAEKGTAAGSGARLIRLGLQDTFAHGASKGYLMKEYGLDAPALVRALESLAGTLLHIPTSALGSVRVDPVHSLSKAEAL
jgi:transketolase